MYELSADATILKSLPLDIYALSVHLQLKKKKKKKTETSFNFWLSYCKQISVQSLSTVAFSKSHPHQLGSELTWDLNGAFTQNYSMAD